MTLRKLMQEAKQNLLKEKRSLEKLLSDAPPGMLIYSRNTANNKVYCKWYVSSCDKFGKRSKTYIPNKDRGLARELALKRLRLKRLDDVKSQLRAIDSFLAKYREHSDLNDLLDAPMLGNLLAEERKPAKEIAEELKRWEEKVWRCATLQKRTTTVARKQKGLTENFWRKQRSKLAVCMKGATN